MPDIKQAFPPILGETPRLLILGSMPGEASLRLGQYYGHGRNAFWPILCELLGVPAEADYSTRTRALIERGIALWDVIAACERDGSLDTAIQPASIQVNDFATHFEARPGFARIAFNGGSAEREYRRRVLPSLPDRQRQLPRVRLPSTSPAHAGMRFEAKLAAWRVLLNWLAD